MKVTSLGHSAYLVEAGNVKALIDPFISGNPSCNMNPEDFTGITHIFVTHGHGDHLGDTVKIAKDNNSLVVTVFELGQMLIKDGLNVHTMHIGGRSNFDFGSVKLTPALHGAGIFNGDHFVSGGNPCGFVLTIGDRVLYHAGDTGLTMDMQLLAYENIDVAIIPIGGKFTMDINDAVRAVDFIKPKIVIPMHYNTFAGIEANPNEFKRRVENVEVKILEAGESMFIN